jgi:transcriptional regulator with XRE-family HTH domain
VDVGRSPASARRHLGSELRVRREAAGKKIEDAAKALYCSTAKISRLENGKGVPNPREVQNLIEYYGATSDERNDQLVQLAVEGRAQDWYSSYRDVVKGPSSFADHLELDGPGRFVALEQDAAAIKLFEANLIPGLLQTEEYINEVCSIVFPGCTDEERARFVEFRLERQNVLLRAGQPLDLEVVLDELAIVRGIGSSAIMRRQLESLVEEFADDRIDLRLTPLTTVADGAIGGPFSIFRYADPEDQDFVYIEGREGAQYLESDEEVARYEQILADLRRVSLSRVESLQRLRVRIGEIG